jgi:predicted PurR-regulated permease PerM
MLKNKDLFSEKNLSILQDVLSKIKNAWWIIIEIFLALILSFTFIIDLEKLKIYFSSMKKTTFSFFYEEYSLILSTVVNSFWKVFKAQAIIALVNTTLTIIWLLIIWLFYSWGFPFIYTLAIIVFIAWFIPVVWTFISSIPIIIVAVAMVWWIQAWIAVLILISVVHSIEAYYLNPKIVSSFMKMPISLTFLILIVSEHLMWIAWLIVWVSLFNFFEELFKDIDKITKKTTKKIAKKIK